MWNISKYKYLPYCNKLLCICFKTNQLKWYDFDNRNPNGNSSGYWRPYTVEGRDYLNLDLNITMSSSVYKDRVDFWTTTVPDIVRQCQPHSVNSSTTFLPNSLVLFVNVLAVICILI